MAWTDQMVEDLRKMWKEGLTTGEIGRRLNVSKNSIVGKVHRLGLSGRPSPIKKKEDNAAPDQPKAAPAPKAADKKPAKTPAAKSAPKAPAAPSPKTETKPQEKTAAPVVEKAPIIATKPAAPAHKHYGNLSLTELDNHTCRWPIGDPKDENFHFCGKKVRIGQTYCEEHAAMAYVKPTKK